MLTAVLTTGVKCNQLKQIIIRLCESWDLGRVLSVGKQINR